MKVTFVFPDLNVFQDFSRDYSGSFSHGIGCLSSSLKNKGHVTSLIHIVETMSKESFLSRVGAEKPDLIAFSSLSHQFGYVKKLLGWLNERYTIPTVCGGVHATIDPEDAIQADGIDMLCRGEGDYALPELCDKISNGEDISKVKNIWLKKDGMIIKNEVRPLEDDLDKLPFPDRRLFSYKTLYDYKIRMLTILGSRGCPYKCSYCSNHQYQQLYPHNYVRFRSVDNILAEIEEVLSWYAEAEFINFIDDTLCLNKERVREFSDKFPKRFNLPFHGNTRVNLLDEEMMALLKKARCERLDVGIESGNLYMRQEVLNRKITNEQICRAFELARKFDIKMSAYNIIGCPFETPEMILETIKLNAKVKPYSMHNAIFQPYPNTDSYKICVNNGFISTKNVSPYFGESFLTQPQLSKRQILFFRAYFLIIMKLYIFANKLSERMSARFSSIISKSAVYLSRSFIVLKIHFLIFAIFSPIKAVKLLIMNIDPGMARKLKHIIYGRYYMKGRRAISDAGVSRKTGNGSICIISGAYPPLKDGIGDYTFKLIENLKKSDLEITLVTTGNDDVADHVTRERDSSVLAIIKRWNIYAVHAILGLIQQKRFNIVHIQYPTSTYRRTVSFALLPFLIRVFFRKTKVITTLHEFSISYPLNKVRQLLLALFSHRLILTDQKDFKAICRILPWAREKISIIPLGSNIDVYDYNPPEREFFLKGLGASQDAKIVSFFGIIHRNKGVECLLRAASRALSHGFPLYLVIIAHFDPEHNPYHNKIKKLIDLLGIKKNIFMTGYVTPKEISKFLSFSDLCALPFTDGITLRRTTLLAAFVHSKPVISTRSRRYIPAQLVDKENIYLVPINDVQKLTEAVELLCSDNELRKKIGEKAGQTAKTFSWDKIAEAHKKLYKDAIAES